MLLRRYSQGLILLRNSLLGRVHISCYPVYAISSFKLFTTKALIAGVNVVSARMYSSLLSVLRGLGLAGSYHKVIAAAQRLMFSLLHPRNHISKKPPGSLDYCEVYCCTLHYLFCWSDDYTRQSDSRATRMVARYGMYGVDLLYGVIIGKIRLQLAHCRSAVTVFAPKNRGSWFCFLVDINKNELPTRAKVWSKPTCVFSPPV